MNSLSLAKSLECTLLRPNVTVEDVHSGCELAREYHLAAVCVYPVHVALAAKLLGGSDTRVCAAIGFPYGQETIPAKLISIEQAQSDGADEMAVMLDQSALIGGDLATARHELDRVCSRLFWNSLVSTRGRTLLTVVVETSLIGIETLTPLWSSLDDTPVEFVQTSAGHQPRAATEDHVIALRQSLPENISIKAVGGVQTVDDARGLLAAGAVRVGTGSAIVLAQEERQQRRQRRAV